MVRNVPKMVMRHRGSITAIANIVVAAVAYTSAYLLRFDFTIPAAYERQFLISLPIAVGMQYCAFYVFKLTRGWWRYVGVGDFINAVKAACLAAIGLGAFFAIFAQGAVYPRSIFFLNAVLVVGLSMCTRLGVRLWRQVPFDRSNGARKRLLIIGAGDTGETLLREIRQSGRLNYQVVAFIDDDKSKRGAYINGVPVVDGVAATADVASRFRIHEIIVATPSASGTEMRSIIDACRAAEVPFKVMPATWELLDGKASLGAVREVDINDLLRRPPVELDTDAIGRFLRDKRVLVTGAAGSIGSELARQILRQSPRTLVCLDHDENALFYLERSLQKIQGEKVELRYKLGDITDATSMRTLFAQVRPQVVFHAAAHKHVPIIELNPVEGIRNNVLGTETVARLAGEHGAEAFVLISTDKAVNALSVMGATKRIAELLIRTLPYDTRYTAVRFGNVLGSQGSVVPILKEQIANGGPVTITHPDMARYFMTIPEAVELVIQASSMGQGDEVFTLDMGDPVKILDLANDLITLSGLRPNVDIPVIFTGIRPGEKLSEELYHKAEQADVTAHPKIRVARHMPLDRLSFADKLDELRRAVAANDDTAVRRLIPAFVPEYRRQNGTGGHVIPLPVTTAAHR